MKSIEVQLNEALDQIKTLTAENTSLKEAVTAGKVATAKAERGKQLSEAKLPEPCVMRLNEAFKNSTDNAGLKEAINVEAEYIKSLTKITKHNGAADNNGSPISEADTKVSECQERQFNAYRKSGMSIAEASAMSGFTPKK